MMSTKGTLIQAKDDCGAAPPSPAKRGKAGMGVRSVVAVARKLRRNTTDVERKLWHRIRDKQLEEFRFRRQRPIGKYIVDFVCLDAMMIVELDGGQHAEQVTKDELRTELLGALGYRVVRFWNNEVIDNIDGVLERIRELLLQPVESNPTCSARFPMHRETVRQAASMLAETPASPPTLPFAGEGADRASAGARAVTPSPATRGKAGMGVRLRNPGVQNKTKDPSK